LILTDFQAADEGLYYCVLTNPNGDVFSPLAELQTAKLIGYWKLDDADGSTVATDYSGFDHHGTIYGIPNDAAGDPNGPTSLNFDGIDNYVDIPTAALDPLVNQITVSLWQYGSSFQPVANAVIGAINEVGRAFTASIPSSNGANIIWDCPNYTAVGGVYDRLLTSVRTADDYKGRWHQYVFTKNAVTGEMHMYQDGALFASAADRFEDTFGSNITDFEIGHLPSDAGFYYSGLLKEIRVYNYALDAEGVAELYYDETGEPTCVYPPVMDGTGDCVVNLADFSLLASEWLECGLIPSLACD
jgi:hypothetical protein